MHGLPPLHLLYLQFVLENRPTRPYLLFPPFFGYDVDVKAKDIVSSDAAAQTGGVSEERAAEILGQVDTTKICDAFWSDLRYASPRHWAAAMDDPVRLENAKTELESQLSTLLEARPVLGR